MRTDRHDETKSRFRNIANPPKMTVPFSTTYLYTPEQRFSLRKVKSTSLVPFATTSSPHTQARARGLLVQRSSSGCA